MRTTYILCIGLALFLASTGSASAYEADVLDVEFGNKECNGVVALNCQCPAGGGSLTCRDGHQCVVYAWAGWGQCAVGSL